MKRYALTLAVEDDLNGIWQYTYKQWSFDQAEKYYDQLEVCCEAIGKDQARLKRSEGLPDGVCVCRCQKHWDKLNIIHCGIEPDGYQVKVAVEPSAPHLVFVCRQPGGKGVPVLLDALSRLVDDTPDLRVTLICDGPEWADLETLTQELGLGPVVTFAGSMSQDEVAETLAGAEALALPSFAKGVPVPLMEAMASRLPVLASRVCGISELVEDGISGYLVPPGNAGALTARLRDLLRDPRLRARIGAAGRAKLAIEFNQQTEVSRLAQLMAPLVKEIRSPHGTE